MHPADTGVTRRTYFLPIGSFALGCLLAAIFSLAARAEDAGFRRLYVQPSSLRSDTVYFTWSGRIAEPMAAEIKAAFAQWRKYRQRIVLQISSGGGSVSEGRRVIKVLRRIRKTHTLDTVVGRGRTCGSMCIPIYLQGHIRYAARSSTWLFHQVGVREKGTRKYIKLNPLSSDLLYHDFYQPAGVDKAWLDKMRRLTRGYDYWQTGDDLITAAAGIIHVPLGKHRRRIVVAPTEMPIRIVDCGPDRQPLKRQAPGRKVSNRNAQGTEPTGPSRVGPVERGRPANC